MEAINLLIPAASGGRIVMGNPLVGFDKDLAGRPYLDKNQQPVRKFAFNLAVPKNDPSVQNIIDQLYAVARAGFPTMFDANGRCLRHDFAFKIIDGDSMDMDQGGTRWCDKEGYQGSWVFKFNTQFAPKCYTEGGASVIIDPKGLKTGDYVRVYASAVGNSDNLKPGIFLNPSIVELIGYGKEISNGPNAAAIFGAAPVTSRPAGASAAPVASSAPIAPPLGTGIPTGFPAPAAPHTGSPPLRTVQPAHDFLQPPAVSAPAAPAPAAPPPKAERYFVVNGVSYPESALRTAGWTEAQLATLV